MQIKNIVLFHIILICDLIKESLSYNDSIPFNWTKIPDICYVDDFVVTNQNRPYYEDIYPVRGCNSDERNRLYALKGANFGLTNITYEPALDFFFPRQKFPPLNSDPPSSMTFRITTRCNQIYKYFSKNQGYVLKIFFGRSEDYLSVPIKSKKYGFTIQKYPKTNKKVLQGRVKIIKDYLINDPDEYNYTIHDYEILEYEGEDFYALFDGYELDFSFLNRSSSYTKLSSSSDFCKNNNDVYAIILKVYDLPRMKVQGLFQYNLSEISPENEVTNSFIYTVDTRNIFFQNISMFYNQHVNVTKEGLEPTAEDSGIWINTTCNVPNVATIMVDYFFFETIHKMQYFGYEFSDRFQLRIHTPYYRKTLNKKYSLFRSQWNSSYPKPRVFIHPIYKYREYCKVVNCTEMFNYTKWTTDPIFTSFIMEIMEEKEIEKEKEVEIFEENLEFIENEIFHELEINDVKEIIEEYKKEEIEEEIHNLIEKEKELEKEIFKEQEKEILFENEKEKELIYERIIEDEEEIIFVKEKEREIIFEKEKEDEEEIIIENEKEREIIIENEKEREKIIEKEKELNYEREKEKEEEISVEKEKEKEKISEIEKEIEIFNEEEVLFEKELILEKEEKELISEKAQETSFESEIEIEIQKEIIIEKEKEIEIKREIETEIEKNDFIEEIEKESEIFDIKKEKEIEKEYEKETETEKNKEIEIEKANEKGELLEKEEEIKHELEKEKEKEQKKRKRK